MKPASAVALELISLSAGQMSELPNDSRERAIVVLNGSCTARFSDSGRCWRGLGGRADVFDGPATAVYAPPGHAFEVVGEAEGVRLAVVSANASHGREPYLVMPEDVEIEHRGRGAWARQVHNILGPKQPADRIVLGETFSTGNGVWSGYPPHKHDKHDPPYESRLDEVFLIQVRPASGFGVLIQYSSVEDSQRATVVHDGDIVSVDAGFHSFVAAAGHSFYYLWALAGEGRALLTQTDARYKWLLEQSAAEPRE